MSIVPSLLLTLVLVPIYYLCLGTLAQSNLVHPATRVDWVHLWRALIHPRGNRVARQIATTSPSAQVTLGAVCVAIAMTAVLAGLTFLLVRWQGLITAFMVTLEWFLITYLLAYVLNSKGSIAQAVAGTAAATVITALHVLLPEVWPISALAATLMLSSVLIQYSKIPFRVLLFLSVGFFFYDVINVYGTGYMVDLAEQLTAQPTTNSMIITVPSSLNLTAEPSAMIGLGDIIFPGFWMLLAFQTPSGTRRTYVVGATLAGISLGWVATEAILLLSSQPVPALMTLLPGALLGYLLGKRLSPQT